MKTKDSRTTGGFPSPALAAAALVSLNGAIALIEALIPKPVGVFEWMLQWVPVDVVLHSRLLLAFSGISLLLLARGLVRRKKVAWRLAIALMAILLLSHLGRAFDWHHALMTFAVGALLVWRRGEFVAQSDQPSLRRAIRMAPALFVVLFMLAFFGMRLVYRETGTNADLASELGAATGLLFFQWPDLGTEPPPRYAYKFFATIEAGVVIAALFSLGLLLRPVIARYRATEEERQRVREIVGQFGQDPMDEFALLEDKLYFFVGDSVVAYALWRNIAVALACPIGPPEEKEEAIRAFRTFCAQQEWKPVFSQFPAEHLAHYEAQGMAALKIAEDARLDLGAFSLQGGKFQNIRTACNKARKAGMTVRWYGGERQVEEAVEEQLAEISGEWLAAKGDVEMTFDLGQFSIDEIRRREVSYSVHPDGRIDAFASWLPFAHGAGRCIDLMRARHEARGGMDFLIAESLLEFRDRGVRHASLGNAPLANTDPETPHRLPDKAVKYLFENFNQIYGCKSLFEFKEKYQPHWQSRYLAYASPADLPLAAVALARVHLTVGLLRLLRS